jgi:hypothetical protein
MIPVDSWRIRPTELKRRQDIMSSQLSRVCMNHRIESASPRAWSMTARMSMSAPRYPMSTTSGLVAVPTKLRGPGWLLVSLMLRGCPGPRSLVSMSARLRVLSAVSEDGPRGGACGSCDYRRGDGGREPAIDAAWPGSRSLPRSMSWSARRKGRCCAWYRRTRAGPDEPGGRRAGVNRPVPAVSGMSAVLLPPVLGVLAAEGVGDALVGGVGLPVDAVGVDLEQDDDAVPGPAGDLGGGHAGVQRQGHAGVPVMRNSA